MAKKDFKNFREKLEKTKIETYEHGCLIGNGASKWLVCFVPGLDKQWWHPYAHPKHKHSFAIRYRDGHWTIFEPWWNRMLISAITPEQAKKYLLWAVRGNALLVQEYLPGEGSQLRGWMNCSALVSYMLGRDYYVWTPHRLYKKLLKEPDVKEVDVALFFDKDFKISAKTAQKIFSS